MKKLSIILAGLSMVAMTSCIEEFAPQGGSVSQSQAASAPNSFKNFVDGLTSTINGKFLFGAGNHYANDYGYSSFYLMRDVMGNDMVPYGDDHNWYTTWYESGVSLAPIYLNAQFPLTFYYSQIYACNTVIKLASENMDKEEFIQGAGLAHCLRALWYLEAAQMYGQIPYGVDKNAPTAPIVTDALNLTEATMNPRATNEEMYAFIIEDLNKAEEYLANYTRADKFTPDLSVVYGVKARAYLVMEDWANAEKYAKLAQQGYTPLTAAQYTDRNHAFNSVDTNNSWMFAMTFKSNDPTITTNDGDNSWGTWMICEFPGGASGLGYFNSYGAANYIDRHLYESIPATDCRKKCFVDFSVDELETKAEIIAALSNYSDVPDYVYLTGLAQGVFGGMPLKFRSKDGNHTDPQYTGWCVDLPIMRVEEMMLIEAEAAGRQNEGRGIQLLTAFAQLRDPDYVYGQHNEAYYNASTPAFVNECWWQRRAEFWGEGLSAFDVKRLQKGIIRSYPETNHIPGYRWNLETTPQWMTYCFVQTESNYNDALVNNPTPIPPDGDSPEYSF